MKLDRLKFCLWKMMHTVFCLSFKKTMMDKNRFEFASKNRFKKTQ